MFVPDKVKKPDDAVIGYAHTRDARGAADRGAGELVRLRILLRSPSIDRYWVPLGQPAPKPCTRVSDDVLLVLPTQAARGRT